MNHTRRDILGVFPLMAAVAHRAAAVPARIWKPKIGVLCRYTEANIEFAAAEGFKSLELSARPRSSLDAAAISDGDVDRIKNFISRTGLKVSAISSHVNHTAPDPAERAQINSYVAKAIGLAGKMGVPHFATMSGNMPGRPFPKQVDEIVRVYNEKYFPLCEKHKVRMIWEPWPGGPNLATGPVGYDALFKAFDDSPYVGIQFDPSHFLRQFMDPIRCMRDYRDKIYDMHLKDTEILWPILNRCGIDPPDKTRWWRYRIPGYGEMKWPEVFTVLMDAGYEGCMNIEHEDMTYGFPLAGDEFSEEFKTGLRMSLRYLRQFVPV